jgi:hypothetical protein
MYAKPKYIVIVIYDQYEQGVYEFPTLKAATKEYDKYIKQYNDVFLTKVLL